MVWPNSNDVSHINKVNLCQAWSVVRWVVTICGHVHLLYSQPHKPTQPPTLSGTGKTHAAARVISGTRKFDCGLMRLLHEDLHWLDIPQRITFKLCLQVFKCLHGLAPRYLRAMRTGRRRRRHGAPQSGLRHSRSTKFPSVQHDKLVEATADEHFRTPALMPGTHCQNMCDKPHKSNFSSAL